MTLEATPGASPTSTIPATEPTTTPGASGSPSQEAQGTTPTEPTAQGGMEARWDDDTKAYIKKLREEAAGRRTKAKDAETQLAATNEQLQTIKKTLGLEEGGPTPEEQVQSLTSTAEDLQFNNLILQSAMENGIGIDQLEYYQFLIGKRVEGLEEGEELSEEDLEEIISKVGQVGGGMSSTSVSTTTNPQGTQPSPGASQEVTLEQFTKMNMSEKTDLFSKNRPLYDHLMAEAKTKNMIA